jgi:hypothetical protein
MKKKVRKFASGGDILTALGAGLAGYGAYKYFTKDKGESKDDDYTRRVKEYGTKGKFPEEKSEEKADAKKATSKSDVVADKDEARDAAQKRAVAASKGRPELVPEVLSDKDKNTLYESDKALVRTDGGGGGANKPKPRIPPKKQVNKPYPRVTKNFVPNEERAAIPYPSEQADATKRALNENKTATDKRLKPSDVSGVGFGATSLTNIGRGEAAAREKAAKDRLNKFEERRKEAKEREARRTQAQNKAKSGTSLRAPGSSMNLNDPYAMMLGSEFDPKRMVRDNKSRIPGDRTEYKKGGEVKKYASGGKVKSASSRADGCAIRGKTRA